jgi:hypothetical protein
MIYVYFATRNCPTFLASIPTFHSKKELHKKLYIQYDDALGKAFLPKEDKKLSFVG